MSYVVVLSLLYVAIFSVVTTVAGIGLNLVFFKKGRPTRSTVIMFLIVALLIMFVVCSQIMPTDVGNIGFAITAALSMFALYKTIDV